MMTIVEALKADKLNRIALTDNSRWMYWTGETGGVDEIPNKWIVRESRRRRTQRLIVTDSEEEAVKVLLEGTANDRK
jgi:hypothetical protein